MPGFAKEGRRSTMLLLRAGLTFAVVLLASSLGSSAMAAEKDLSDKGEVLLRENCARCHAIGTEDVSANSEAPPFRTLSSKYPVEDLAESLAEGIVSGHPEMPIFVFKPHDIDAIIIYLESIQETEPDASTGETTDG